MRLAVLPLLFLLQGVVCAAPADLVAAAKAQIGVTRTYDPSYRRIAYPGGDVPIERGVCSDVVIRAYRKIGIDLQEQVHRDMLKAWKAYPHPAKWGLTRPDTNIDHRRVPNLETFFARHGRTLPKSDDPRAYQPGDIVSWRIPPSLPHIGIVSDERSATGVPLVIHNIGYGATLDDTLFAFPITGHYRFP